MRKVKAANFSSGKTSHPTGFIFLFFIGAQRLNKDKPREGWFVKFPQNIHFSYA